MFIFCLFQAQNYDNFFNIPKYIGYIFQKKIVKRIFLALYRVRACTLLINV